MEGDMQKAVKKDILNILKKAQRYINKMDSKELKHLSDYAIRNTSVFQDPDSLSLAVFIYTLSKLLERWGFEGEYADEARKYLSSAQFSLEQQGVTEYREQMKKLGDFISSIEKEYRIYVEKVIDKAQIKKGSNPPQATTATNPRNTASQSISEKAGADLEGGAVSG